MADLLEYGINAPTPQWSPLLRSVFAGDVAGTLEAIIAGGDVNDRTSLSFNALHLAALLNHCEIGLILLRNSAKINSKSANRSLAHDGSTALMLAAGRGHTEFVRLLLDNKAKYNLVNIHQFSALHRAVCMQEPEVVRMLLEMPKIDLQAKTSMGNTALDLAGLPIYNDRDIVRMLSEAERR